MGPVMDEQHALVGNAHVVGHVVNRLRIGAEFVNISRLHVDDGRGILPRIVRGDGGHESAHIFAVRRDGSPGLEGFQPTVTDKLIILRQLVYRNLLHGLSGLDGNGRTPFGTGFVVFDGQGKRFPVFALFCFQPRSTGSDLIIRRRSLDGDFERLILFAEKSTQYLAEIHIVERLSLRRFAARACRQGQYDGKAFG